MTTRDAIPERDIEADREKTKGGIWSLSHTDRGVMEMPCRNAGHGRDRGILANTRPGGEQPTSV